MIIDALKGGDTYTYILTLWTKAISRSQVCVMAISKQGINN